MAKVVTNTGLGIISGLVSGVTSLLPKYAAWGTGAGTSAVTDTTLFTEDTTAGYARIIGMMTQITTTTTNDTWQIVATITAQAALTITNHGDFDALTVGNLLFKDDFTGLALNIGDGIQFTDAIQF